jgi:heme/copper-type cytochrome/quinol oxidase subunit 2
MLVWACSVVSMAALCLRLLSPFIHSRQVDRHDRFHRSPLVEFFWNLIPAVIMVAMAMPAIYTAVGGGTPDLQRAPLAADERGRPGKGTEINSRQLADNRHTAQLLTGEMLILCPFAQQAVWPSHS